MGCPLIGSCAAAPVLPALAFGLALVVDGATAAALLLLLLPLILVGADVDIVLTLAPRALCYDSSRTREYRSDARGKPHQMHMPF